MGTTWKQKKEIAGSFIKRYYGPSFLREGFYSHEEGFSWYRVKNGLLYIVHIMPLWQTPFDLDIYFGVHPLFSWEYIAYTSTISQWPGYVSLPEHGCKLVNIHSLAAIKLVLGELPRPYSRYLLNYIAHFVNDVFLSHWNTERMGVELLEELIFPFFNKLDTFEKVYDLHKAYRLMQFTNLKTPPPLISFVSEKEYFGNHQVDLNRVPLFVKGEISVAFADECLFAEDRAWYPEIRQVLLKQLSVIDYLIANFGPYKTKKGREEAYRTAEHVKKLIEYIDCGNREMLEAELEKNKERMLEQIRSKLPMLKPDTLELQFGNQGSYLSHDPFIMS